MNFKVFFLYCLSWVSFMPDRVETNGRSYTLTALTQYFHGWFVGGVSRCKKETLIKTKKNESRKFKAKDK